MWTTLFELLVHGAVWSMLAVGGSNVTLADIQRYTVETRHWLTATQFVTFYSITQAAPGPNGMAVALIGLQAAGLPGALVSTLANCVPSSCIAFFVGGWAEQHREVRWVVAVRRGLAPVTVGLLGSASYVLAREIDINLTRIGLTLVCTAIAFRSKLNPIWLVLAGALLGLSGVM
jgi:chromate transporter